MVVNPQFALFFTNVSCFISKSQKPITVLDACSNIKMHLPYICTFHTYSCGSGEFSSFRTSELFGFLHEFDNECCCFLFLLLLVLHRLCVHIYKIIYFSSLRFCCLSWDLFNNILGGISVISILLKLIFHTFTKIKPDSIKQYLKI